MKYTATSPDDYVSQLPEERAIVISKLRSLIQENIPEGFTEEMSYGMIGYIVPHSLYSEGYHCDPSLPLPFINIASQKNFIAFYHMGMYADKNLYDWFYIYYIFRDILKIYNINFIKKFTCFFIAFILLFYFILLFFE